MSTSRNDITGDIISTKHNSTNYVNNWDLIFGKKDKDEQRSNERNKIREGIDTSENASNGCSE